MGLAFLGSLSSAVATLAVAWRGWTFFAWATPPARRETARRTLKALDCGDMWHLVWVRRWDSHILPHVAKRGHFWHGWPSPLRPGGALGYVSRPFASFFPRSPQWLK